MSACLRRLSIEQVQQMTEVLADGSFTRFRALAEDYRLCPHCALHYVMMTDISVMKGEGIEADDVVHIFMIALAKVYGLDIQKIVRDDASTPPRGGTVH